MNKPLEQMTIEELKAIGFDQMNELARIQQNLQIINARIQELSKLPKEEVTKNENKSK